MAIATSIETLSGMPLLQPSISDVGIPDLGVFAVIPPALTSARSALGRTVARGQKQTLGRNPIRDNRLLRERLMRQRSITLDPKMTTAEYASRIKSYR